MKPLATTAVVLASALLVRLAAAQPSPVSTTVYQLRVGVDTSFTAGASPPPCQDPAFALDGATWPGGSYKWYFQRSSTPTYLSKSAVRDVLKKSLTNITSARNDCGLPDKVSATHTFLGVTDRRPSDATSDTSCAKVDGRNVIGFRALPVGRLASVCFQSQGENITEVDVQINTLYLWALSTTGCVNRAVLEGVMTHEAGHVFGLNHVGEAKHGRLTMSAIHDGPCSNNEATLGWGDVRGLNAMY